MNDETLDQGLREHYETRGLDPKIRGHMIAQARSSGRKRWVERAVLWVAIAAVIVLALQLALTRTVEGPVAPNVSAASGKLREAPDPVRDTVPELVLLTNGHATITCGAEAMSVTHRRVLPLNVERLPMSCLVDIDGVMGVFQVTGEGVVRCDSAEGRVTCVESVK